MSDAKPYKFVKIDETSLLLDSLIQDNSKEFSVLSPVSVFDPSRVTECPRRMMLRANGSVPEKYTPYLLTYHDSSIKTKWTNYLSQCKSIKVLDRNVVAADCHYNISGNADAILKIGDSVYVTKIQPVNDEEFLQVKKNGAFKRHVVELIIYTWLTELRDGLLLYENQNTHEYMTLHIKQYEPIIKSVLRKCLKLMEEKVHGIVPPRPYKTKEASECVACEFAQKCWQERNTNA